MSRAAAGLALVAALTTLVGPAPTADASSTYLCTGYSGCAARGYSHAGYGAANDRMYWRMYSGHNCTNYAAYRMIRAGMSATRPWSGSGMAYNWGLANRRITDQTPTVGSIAWWNRYSGGVGSSGHVAYVERVVSPTEIVISEDSWGGDFAWRRIVKDGRGWPSGFIHFINPKVITNTTSPRVVGTPQVGRTLTARIGGWKGAPTSHAFQWLADGAAVRGATAQTFAPGTAQLGARISVRVTARRAGYQAGTATSAATTSVANGGFTTVAPTTVAGTPQVGQVLRATRATFAPAPERTVVQWRADGVVIPRATGNTYRVDASVAGKNITALTLAHRAGYTRAGSHSAPLGPVTVGAVQVTTPYTVSRAPRVGATLTVTPGTSTPADAVASYAWLRDGVPIAGATGPAYRVTAADAGADLSVRVRLTRASYTEWSQVLPSGRALATATMRVNAVGRARSAMVGIRVWAAGGVDVDGRARVQIGDRRAPVDVVDGFARFTMRRLDPGHRVARVVFLGSDAVTRAESRTKVVVLR